MTVDLFTAALDVSVSSSSSSSELPVSLWDWPLSSEFFAVDLATASLSDDLRLAGFAVLAAALKTGLDCFRCFVLWLDCWMC